MWESGLTAEQRSEWKIRRKAQATARYWRNPARALAYHAAWRARHPGKPYEYECVWRGRFPERARDKARKRAAMRRGAFIEDVDFEVIWARDIGICQICGLGIDRQHQSRRWRPSLDHIIALVLGGAHCYENIDLTHLACNLRKADAAIEDLPPGFYWAGRPHRPGVRIVKEEVVVA